MTNETNKEFFPTIEKQLFLANGIGFKIVSTEPKDSYKTNYAYYLKQKGSNGSLTPLIGRMNEKQLQVYMNGSWVDKDLWKDFSEPIVENGKVVLNTNGKPKQRLLIDHKFDWLVEFDEPVPVEFYSKEMKQVVSELMNKFYIRTSKSMSEKFIEQLADKRNNKETRYTVDYDPEKSPAEQYKVKFHSQK